MSGLIVTIDGPGGTGKSTVSREVARRRSLPHLDTGAYYRAATLAALVEEVDLASEADVVRVVGSAEILEEEDHMFLDGVDVSAEIRGELVTASVSEVSAHPGVREILVDRQREWVRQHGGSAVVEGRDIGSVVFPDAAVKIYLDASPEVRARRRALQMGESPDQTLVELERRDSFDSGRKASPLTVPPDAVVIDTSDLSFEDVVKRVLALIEAHS